MIYNLEAFLPHKSIWQTIASERRLGRVYLHGVTGYNYDGPFTREQILSYCTGVIKEIEKLFDEFKPDIFIPALGVGGIETAIFEAICKKRNVNFLTITTTRIKNRICITISSCTKITRVTIIDERIRNFWIYGTNNASDGLY